MAKVDNPGYQEQWNRAPAKKNLDDDEEEEPYSLQKNLALLGIRLLLGVNLFFRAENGGHVKWGMGHAKVVDEHVLNWGYPFDNYPGLFATILMAAECIGSLVLIAGMWTKFASNITILSMGILTYIHLFVNEDGLLSIFHNRSQVFGSFVYLIMAAIISWYGPGEFAVEPHYVRFVHSKLHDHED